MRRGIFRPYGELGIRLRWFSMFKRWIMGKYNSLYIKIFLSFLATCVLFFIGLFRILELLFYGFILQR